MNYPEPVNRIIVKRERVFDTLSIEFVFFALLCMRVSFFQVSHDNKKRSYHKPTHTGPKSIN